MSGPAKTAEEMSFERATPKVKVRKIYVRILFAREILTRFFAAGKLLIKMVARDGFEPPTPAFSGPLTESPKWFESSDVTEGQELMPWAI